MLAGRSSSNVLRTTRRFCAAGSRFEWQTLPSGLRIKHVSDGNQGDGPVGDNQTIRVTYSTRLEDNTEIISNRVASFKICQALDEGVRGMRVGDRRVLRAPFNMTRGPAVARAPKHAILEYDVLLTGSVHHMTIVTLEQPGSEDPLQKLWHGGQRWLESMLGGLSKKKDSPS